MLCYIKQAEPELASLELRTFIISLKLDAIDSDQRRNAALNFGQRAKGSAAVSVYDNGVEIARD